MTALMVLSDVLVVRALERACSRGLTGDARRAAHDRLRSRHRAYEIMRVPETRLTYALDGAWETLPEFAGRWQLAVEPTDWAQVLDRYCRDLIRAMQPHTLDRLDEALRLLGAELQV